MQCTETVWQFFFFYNTGHGGGRAKPKWILSSCITHSWCESSPLAYKVVTGRRPSSKTTSNPFASSRPCSVWNITSAVHCKLDHEFLWYYCSSISSTQLMDTAILFLSEILTVAIFIIQLTAAGPFTTSDNLAYEPFVELLAYARKKRPNLLVLVFFHSCFVANSPCAGSQEKSKRLQLALWICQNLTNWGLTRENNFNAAKKSQPHQLKFYFGYADGPVRGSGSSTHKTGQCGQDIC